MNIEKFLVKLFKDHKISITEPSDNIKNAYLKKSESALISAKILIENKRLEESVR